MDGPSPIRRFSGTKRLRVPYQIGFALQLLTASVIGSRLNNLKWEGSIVRGIALILLFAMVANSEAQRLDKSFAPPSGSGGFDSTAIFGAPPPIPKTPIPPTPPPIPELPEDAELTPYLNETAPPPPPPAWNGGLEFGLNGSQGNSEILKIRVGGEARRETASNLFRANLFYGIASQNSVRNENKMLFTSIDEIKLSGSNWSPFLSNAVEYDEFRAFDFRIAGHAGASYTFIKDKWTLVKSRLGAGASAEFSSQENTPGRWIPEGLVGLDLEHQFTDRQKFVSTVDYFPDLAEFARYRIRFRAAYEILVDPETNLTLRLGVQDRYDSKPGPNTLQNDIDYFATMILRF